MKVRARRLSAFHSSASIYHPCILCCDAAGNITALSSRLWSGQSVSSWYRTLPSIAWWEMAQCEAKGCDAGWWLGMMLHSCTHPILHTALQAMCNPAVIKPLPGFPNSSMPPCSILQPCLRERGLTKDIQQHHVITPLSHSLGWSHPQP